MSGRGAQLPLLLGDPPVHERVSRRARRVGVTVRADGAVVLTIPWRGSRRAAYEFLEQSRAWIARQQARRAAAPRPPPLRWDGNDRLPLRGVDTVVEVVPASLRQPRARVEAGAVRLYAPKCQPARLQRLLLQALKAEAHRDAVRFLDEEAMRLGLRHGGLAVRDPRSRWGSCSADGRIMLSWRLVMAPPEVFRYVVVHELCHLRWRGHGPRFWGLVARQLPDFETQRAWLRRHGDALHGQPPRG